MEIFKPFNDSTKEDLKNGGFKILIPWNKLVFAIEAEAKLRPWETMAGWIIDEEGVQVVVRQKPGRKAT